MLVPLSSHTAASFRLSRNIGAPLYLAATTVSEAAIEQTMTKEGAFCKWMAADFWEEVSDRPLQVTGTIPKYVHGNYVKNGPGAFTTSKRKYTHAFDGLAKLIKFDIHHGDTIAFSAKFIDSDWKRSMMDHDTIPPSITTGPASPAFDLPERLYAAMTSATLFDNTPVNVEQIGTSRYMAVTDAPVMNEFELQTLTAKGRWTFPPIGGMAGYPIFSTAHGKKHLGNGNNYNYFLSVGLDGIQAHMVRTNADGSTRTSLGKVSTRGKIPYVHDISLTENYAILCLYPLTLNPPTLLSGKGFLEELVFDPTESAKIHVFPLNGTGPIVSLETPAFFAYHHVNAYEKDDRTIILDMLAYENANMINGPHGFLYMDNMMTARGRSQQVRDAHIWRWKLDLMTPNMCVMPEKTNECTMELATVSPLVQGKSYRYAYGFTGFHQPGFMDWAIVKQDLEGNGNGFWYEEWSYPGEPVFVPDPSGKAEDDGVLLCSVYNSKLEEIFLLVLNASTMKEVARAYTGIGM